MRTVLITAVAAALLAAGCVSEPASESLPAAVDEAGAEAPEELVVVDVYDKSDLVTGGSPPSPAGPGPLAEAIPIAKTDAFEVPEGTQKLVFTPLPPTGTGNARLEIYDPEGKRVYVSDTHHVVGVPGVIGATVDVATAEASGDDPAPGTYQVRYYVAGAVAFGVKVVAHVDEAAEPEAEEPASA